MAATSAKGRSKGRRRPSPPRDARNRAGRCGRVDWPEPSLPQPACAPRASVAVAAACFRAKVAGQPAFAGERTARACWVPADGRRVVAVPLTRWGSTPGHRDRGTRRIMGRMGVTVRSSRYGHESGPTARWRCRRPAPVDVPVHGGCPDRIGSLFDDACPTAATPDTGRTERLRWPGKRSVNPVWTWERANRTLALSTASTGRCPLRREGARTGSARCSTVLARLPQRRIPAGPNAYMGTWAATPGGSQSLPDVVGYIVGCSLLASA